MLPPREQTKVEKKKQNQQNQQNPLMRLPPRTKGKLSTIEKRSNQPASSKGYLQLTQMRREKTPRYVYISITINETFLPSRTATSPYTSRNTKAFAIFSVHGSLIKAYENGAFRTIDRFGPNLEPVKRPIRVLGIRVRPFVLFHMPPPRCNSHTLSVDSNSVTW
ncbi:hypothetical protein YC2023_041820 [Brassica napus]